MLRSITNDVCEQFPHLETTVVAINSVQIYIVAVSLTLQTGLYTYSVQTSKHKLETTTVFAVDVVLNRKDAETMLLKGLLIYTVPLQGNVASCGTPDGMMNSLSDGEITRFSLCAS